MKSVGEIEFVVKICGITNEEDAREAVAAGANAIGYNFYPRSPRYVTPERARALIEAVPGSYLRVGVFANPCRQELEQALETVALDVVQLHGDDCAVPPAGTRMWRSLVLPASEILREEFEAYLLDSATPDFGGSGKTFAWHLAAEFPRRAILAGGLDDFNVRAAIRTARPWGVDACSRLEERPGKKDSARMRAFVREALSEARISAGEKSQTFSVAGPLAETKI